MPADFDIFIIGGGVNGCGIARDAVGRGYSVALAEKNDLASGTSSGSTKLIHGGLRYLEHYEFRLVREALSERELLWNVAPHIIWPLRFVLPHHKELRPKWLLRLGLFLYDHIGGRKKLPATRTLDLKKDVTGEPLKDMFESGFEYSDCWVNDARLVALNARDAADRGAVIRTRTSCIRAIREGGLWHVTLLDHRSGEEETLTARVLINASGPWVDNVLRLPLADQQAHNVRLVQGSHVVVPKLYNHDRCYIFQNADDRIIFAIPYEEDFTLIGTTDHDFDGSLDNIQITKEETAYLCSAASEYFNSSITPDQVVWTYSGVRPLYDDGASKAQEATRDYVLRMDGDADAPKLINVFGGKITTYRRLAESMLEKIEEAIGKKGDKWTATAKLPGGHFAPEEFDKLVDDYHARFGFLDKSLIRRYCRAYGTQALKILDGVQTVSDLGTDFGGGLYEAEVRYLIDNEWAVEADDILWRRSKLGLRLTEAERVAFADWMGQQEIPTRAIKSA
ncbi:glycerol-3-phosphate dehydrogenase [Sneathiella limimaris]|uniref:glycerol-3-phosphate dehydrogenase n=1 Tax=Sneathiella limimaris TaxID=1964213 RepID=UPI00146E0C35